MVGGNMVCKVADLFCELGCSRWMEELRGICYEKSRRLRYREYKRKVIALILRKGGKEWALTWV